MKNLRFLKDERGSTYIELLWTIPILVFLIVGGMAIGGLIVTKLNLLHVEREALRQTAIEGYYDYRAQQTLMSSLYSFDIDPSQVAVQGTPYRQPFGTPAFVDVTLRTHVKLFGLTTPVSVVLTANGNMASQYLPPANGFTP